LPSTGISRYSLLVPQKPAPRSRRITPPRLPRFEDIVREVAENKTTKLRDSLTLPQLHAFVETLRKEVAGLGGAHVPDNPADFAIKFSGGAWLDAAHLRVLSNQIQRMEKRTIRFLCVSMPPRSGKSQLIDIWTPTWWLSRHASDRIILAGYGETFARDWGGKVRDKIIEHADKLNLVMSRDKLAADDWELSSGGGMVCVGVGGSLVGRGADLLIIDDPIKNDAEASSEVYRNHMWEWFQASAFTRLQPNGVMIVVATRWHEDDLIGRIIKNDAQKLWTTVSIPALAEKDDVLGRAEGSPLWPEHFTDDPNYEIRKGSMSDYWFAAQYQQRPSPEGGGIIKEDWFQFYNLEDQEVIVKEADQMIQTWDPALLDKASSDFWAGHVLARKGANIYVIAQAHDHYNLAQATGVIKNWSMKFPKATAKIIENTAMGPAIKQTLQHEVPGIIPVNAKGTKRSRIEAAIPCLQAQNVYLPQNKDGTKPRWVWDLISEACAYDKGTHDDLIDCLCQGINFMTPGGWRDARKAAIENAPVMTPKELATAKFHKYVEKVMKKSERRINRTSGGMRRHLW
jgi:predicted phage terminase large subunit-like protein